MRAPPSWICLLPFAALGCATQRDTGAALVGTGAAAAMVGASAASSSYCSGFGCYYRNPAPWGSKVAAAGAALAAAGYAVMALAPRGDVQARPRPAPPPQTAPGDAWRLRRKDPPLDPPPESTEEEREP